MQLYNALFLKETFANTGYIPIHLNLNEIFFFIILLNIFIQMKMFILQKLNSLRVLFHVIFDSLFLFPFKNEILSYFLNTIITL